MEVEYQGAGGLGTGLRFFVLESYFKSFFDKLNNSHAVAVKAPHLFDIISIVYAHMTFALNIQHQNFRPGRPENNPLMDGPTTRQTDLTSHPKPRGNTSGKSLCVESQA